jgi:hypothetical protein
MRVQARWSNGVIRMVTGFTDCLCCGTNHPTQKAHVSGYMCWAVLTRSQLAEHRCTPQHIHKVILVALQQQRLIPYMTYALPKSAATYIFLIGTGQSS